jgi:beta-galactosidase
MPITVRALDAEGRAVPLAQDEVRFAIAGAGRSIGHGNGDPNSHEVEKGSTRKLFNGLAQLLVQSNWNSSGSIEVDASAPGLRAAHLTIPVKAVAPVAYVPAAIPPMDDKP